MIQRICSHSPYILLCSDACLSFLTVLCYNGKKLYDSTYLFPFSVYFVM
nr:MAG TPA: hypothetical protein [Caudoviricetes sp.]